jgi:hypothetical protein
LSDKLAVGKQRHLVVWKCGNVDVAVKKRTAEVSEDKEIVIPQKGGQQMEGQNGESHGWRAEVFFAE